LLSEVTLLKIETALTAKVSNFVADRVDSYRRK